MPEQEKIARMNQNYSSRIILKGSVTITIVQAKRICKFQFSLIRSAPTHYFNPRKKNHFRKILKLAV